MEARNFVVAREMISENNWFLTTMNGEARYEKPPFPSWITSFFLLLFNHQSTWVYRLPVSVFSTIGLIGMYKLSFILSNLKKLSLYAALILGTSFYYIAIRFEAPSDTFTHVAMIFSVYYLVSITQEQKIIFSAVIGGLWLAVSILSKGPVSLYVLWLPFVIAYAIAFKFKFKSRIWYYIIYLVVGLLIGASWYVYVRIADPIAFLEIAETETSNWSSYNVRPFYYYWSFVIQSGIWTIPAFMSLAYPYFKNKVENKKLYLFTFLWTLLAVVLLSIIPEKKSRYLMPILIPLALNSVQIIFYFIKEINSKFNRTLATVIFIVCLVVIVALPLIMDQSFQFWLWYTSIALFSFIIGFSTLNNLVRDNLKGIIWNYFFIMLLFNSIVMIGIKFLQRNDHYIGQYNKPILIKNVTYYKHLSPEIIFELGRVIQPFNVEDVINFPAFVIVNKDDLKEFEQVLPNRFKSNTIKGYDFNFFYTKADKKYSRRLLFDLIKVTE
jgi:4-amino-4-deoxy-L-arabinose transferase-like glycosyltransferase